MNNKILQEINRLMSLSLYFLWNKPVYRSYIILCASL